LSTIVEYSTVVQQYKRWIGNVNRDRDDSKARVIETKKNGCEKGIVLDREFTNEGIAVREAFRMDEDGRRRGCERKTVKESVGREKSMLLLCRTR